jgi:Asp-tRNA(Asn)/Glu-tRNA(Gln) amidotransferase A subunit family amidase
MLAELSGLSATEAAGKIRSGEISSEELVRACLDRIEQQEPTVHAWRFLDPELALVQARRCDASETRSPLHGVPVAVKDQFDTADMPTGYGSPIYEGHRPVADAGSVASLREAGAVILGKTKLTEFALYHPTDTTNPLDPARTPGGSSSGSAAAVADFMAPAATGTQTVGSIIRPASYCGIFGYKPTFGSISRSGVLTLCASLDHVGLFARTVEDLELFTKVITGTHPHHPSIRTAQPTGFDLRHPDGFERPRIAFVRTPQWPELDVSISTRLEKAVTQLRKAGAVVDETSLPGKFDGLVEAQNTILEVELSCALSYEFENYPDRMSDLLRGVVEQGNSIGMERYLEAQQLAAECRWESIQLFHDHDVLLAPSVRGEAPVGLESTGDPLFCRMWTLLGLPCVSLPGIHGPDGLPLGAQIIGPMYGDGLALSVAGWASRRLCRLP